MGRRRKVKLIRFPERQIDRLRLGMVGEVLATRFINKRTELLVKWQGRSGPVSHEMSEVELL